MVSEKNLADRLTTEKNAVLHGFAVGDKYILMH